MTLQTLANLGEFISGIVVIISLLYLALQIRQNTLSQRTDTYARALDRIATMQARMSERGEFTDILIKGVADHRQLTQRERTQFTWMFYEMFGAFEFMHDQNHSGSLPEAVWQRWADTLLWWMAFPGVQAWWDSRPTPFTPAFTQFIETHRSSERADPDAHQRWVRFLAGSGSP
jgi:hypothetical protein